MNRYLFSTVAVKQWFWRLIGLDFWVEGWDLGPGTYWKIETEPMPGPGGSSRGIQVWAFRRHFMASRWDKYSTYWAN